MVQYKPTIKICLKAKRNEKLFSTCMEKNAKNIGLVVGIGVFQVIAEKSTVCFSLPI